MPDNYVNGYAIITPYDNRMDELFLDIRAKWKSPMTELAITAGGYVLARFEGKKEDVQAYVEKTIFPMKLVKQIKPTSELEMKLMKK